MCCQEEDTLTLLDISWSWLFRHVKENFAIILFHGECDLILLSDAGHSQTIQSGLAGLQGRWWPQAITPDPAQTCSHNRLWGWNLLRRGLLSPRYLPALVAMIKQTKNKNVSWVSEACWWSFLLLFLNTCSFKWGFCYLYCVFFKPTESHVNIFASLLIRFSGLTDYAGLLQYIPHGFWCSCAQWLFQREA